MQYYVNLPYPEIKVEKPNIKYAKIILNNYAGAISEDTAIHLYTFQQMILYDKNPNISNILKEIAKVEMHHLDMLGKIIHLLGLPPAYVSYNQKKNCLIPWNSTYVFYDNNIKKMIESDIQAEESAIVNYTQALEQINDKHIKRIIARIILDEQLHLAIFKKIKNNLL